MSTISDKIETIELGERNNLYKIGIDILTGEACGLSMRLLCDIDNHAQTLINNFLGGIDFLAPGWNSDNKKSLMLTRNFLHDIEIFSLASQYDYVVLFEHSYNNREYCAYFNNVDYDECYQGLISHLEEYKHKIIRIYNRSGTARGGLRNQHEYSGRIE